MKLVSVGDFVLCVGKNGGSVFLPSQTLWKPNFCVQIPTIPQASSRMMPMATALNIVLVERR